LYKPNTQTSGQVIGHLNLPKGQCYDVRKKSQIFNLGSSQPYLFDVVIGVYMVNKLNAKN